MVSEEYREGDLQKFFGIDPDFTGDRTTQQHLDHVRSGDQSERAAEHERLRSVVVEAAQEWEHGTFFDLQDVDKRLDELSEAVRSLNAFETEHNLNSEV